MTWTWRYETNAGESIDRDESPNFDNQSDAESWIGEIWQELLAQGIDSVTLLEDDRVEYARMSLHPAD